MPDEARHLAFGARFLHDMVVLRPKWFDGGDDEPLSVDETRAFALKALERRPAAIGLAATAA
jgi:hypothetical protein